MGGWSERVMGQKGFFDIERRLEAISAKGDPLETIKKMVQWEDFRADIEAVTETKPEERQSNAGRKPYDTILKFKIVVLQSLHNLSDEQTEYRSVTACRSCAFSIWNSRTRCRMPPRSGCFARRWRRAPIARCRSRQA